MTRAEAAEIIRMARFRAGVRWADIAEKIGRAPVWTVAALLGQHPMTPEQAAVVGEMLALQPEVIEALQTQPNRAALGTAAADPTIYRFHEALQVYGPAIKELLHEEFGDGIMSAINFKVDIQRRSDPAGDRVVVTFDGKFLDYNW